MPNVKNQKIILDQYITPPQSQIFIIDSKTIGMTIYFEDDEDQNTFISNYQRGLGKGNHQLILMNFPLFRPYCIKILD